MLRVYQPLPHSSQSNKATTVDAFAHRVGDPGACRIEGIVYVEPHYRPIVCAPVNVGSVVVGRELTLF